jgi:CDGSH-type Zn-finger protein
LKGTIVQKTPMPVELVAGRTYWWCACGLSKNQPFCDGSHKATAFNPVQYLAERTGTAYLCACKQTGNAPMCDGTHKTL